jgi:3-hydroxyacyl-CoA dehydrogenase
MVVENSLEIKNVIIIGCGLMGTGIAQISIEKGFSVTLIGRSKDKLSQAKTKICSGLARIAKKRFSTASEEEQGNFIDSCLDNLKLCTEYSDANFEDADLVIEAVVENLKVKQKLLDEIENLISETCIVATNTSSFLLQDVSNKFGPKSRFVGLHFFNPVPSMKLVEVIKGNETSEEIYEKTYEFCRKIGKSPVRCRDTHGFVVNRLLIPYLLDSIRMYEKGDASKEDIDIAMKLGTGHPMGPFELIDFIGLDTMKFVVDGWHQRFPDDPRFEPCQSLDDLVNDGKLGRKSGEGYHSYFA